MISTDANAHADRRQGVIITTPNPRLISQLRGQRGAGSGHRFSLTPENDNADVSPQSDYGRKPFIRRQSALEVLEILRAPSGD